jgi:hypothetical protein
MPNRSQFLLCQIALELLSVYVWDERKETAEKDRMRSSRIRGASIEIVARQQERLELYHNGRLSASDEKIGLAVTGQKKLIAAARTINDAIPYVRTTASNTFLPDLNPYNEITPCFRSPFESNVISPLKPL